MRRRHAALLFVVLQLAPGLPAEDRPPVLTEARHRGPAGLKAILAHVDSPDPDVRTQARSLAKRIALDYYEASTPEGMRLVPGAITVTATDISCETGFYLGAHEVTVREFRDFALRAELQDRWADHPADMPVTDVSLEEARAFAKSRGARLMTLREFSCAARGGGRLRYPWGSRFDPARVNSREAGRGAPEPVGSRPGGCSVHGIADLLGNVAEWTETPADRQRFIVAGGSYRSYAELAAPPYKLEPSCRLADVGFRLAKSLPPLNP